MRRLIVRGSGLRGPQGEDGPQGPRGPQGNPGPTGPQGLPGTGAVPADAAVAGYINTTGTSATKTALLSGFIAGRAASEDGTEGLPEPTGKGLEFVINADGLDDIRFEGVSL